MLEHHSLPAWIIKNQIKLEGGQDFDFRNHIYLYDFLITKSKNICCLKAGQIGFSSTAILKMLFKASEGNIASAYVLPSQAFSRDFVSGKVNRIINQNQFLQEISKDKDSVEQKQLKDSIIYFKGASNERAAISFSIDLLILDEVDRFEHQNIAEMMESRLQHSISPERWVFSNPSTLGNGVDRYWKKSSQMHWFIICNSCKREHFMWFPDSFDTEEETYICKHCKAELSDAERINGRWVRKFNNTEWEGYYIPLYLAPYISAKRIMELYKTKSAEYFHNFVLGLPYSPAGTKVSLSDIQRNILNEVNNQSGRVFIGVDSGTQGFYTCISNSQGIFWIGLLKTPAELESLLKKYPNSFMVIDAGGDLISPRMIRENYRGRVYLCYFRKDSKTNEMIRWKDDDGSVLVDRERIISLTVEEIVDNRVKYYGTFEDYYELGLHWQELYRKEEFDDLGIKTVKWAKSGQSDYNFAQIYNRIATSRFNNSELSDFISTKVESNTFKTSKLVLPDPNQDFYI